MHLAEDAAGPLPNPTSRVLPMGARRALVSASPRRFSLCFNPQGRKVGDRLPVKSWRADAHSGADRRGTQRAGVV